MKLALGADHAGAAMKDELKGWLERGGYEVLDCGTNGPASVDYPDHAAAVGRAVSSGDADLGILVCGTGIGMSIAANKIPGIRAALVGDVENARLARQHNNANVLCLGGRMIAVDRAQMLVAAWMETPFEPRHQKRLDKIAQLESRENTR